MINVNSVFVEIIETASLTRNQQDLYIRYIIIITMYKLS